MSATASRIAIAPEEPELGGRPRKWTREEYYRAAELGLFRPEERLELLRGEIIQKVSPQKIPHSTAILLGQKVLETAFGPRCHVRPQLPMKIADDGEPEPDLLVVTGTPADYADHPTPADVQLLVEVADRTLSFDRNEKAAAYAEAGIADYWILNLPGRALEVRREPAPLPDLPGGFAYRSITVYHEDEVVSPLAAKDALIRVADLLPPVRAEKARGKRTRGKA